MREKRAIKIKSDDEALVPSLSWLGNPTAFLAILCAERPIVVSKAALQSVRESLSAWKFIVEVNDDTATMRVVEIPASEVSA